MRVKFKGSHRGQEARRAEDRQSPDLTHVGPSSPATRCRSLCFEVYGDPRHYLFVADVNRIDDFRRLTAGHRSCFPPLPTAGGPPMTDTSMIPTPASPDVCSVSVLIDGSEISGEFHVLSASVSNELNRIPVRVGAAPRRRGVEADLRGVSDTDHFVPGKEIEIKLGYRGETETVFKGIIVKHRVRVRKNGTFLSLECRDKAVRMTSGLKSRYYTDTTDGDILDELLGQYGLDRDVATTKPSLKEVVQYDCDRLGLPRVPGRGQRARRRRRATARSRSARRRPTPSPWSPPSFGATVLELDAEIDARWQVKGVKASGLERHRPGARRRADATEPSVTDSGNLSPSDLADVIGGDPHVLRHGGKLGEPRAAGLGRRAAPAKTGSPRSAVGCASRGSPASPRATSSR